jgi:CRP-like cAMP-binding protein
MSLDRTIAALAEHPMFAALEPEALRILAFSSDRLELPRGARLFAQGAAADSGYVVLAGQIGLEVARDGATESLGAVGPGTLIGELALLCATNRPATAVAYSAVEAVKIPRSVFKRLLEEYPAAANELRRRLAERLLALTGSLDEVRAHLENGAADTPR